MTARTSRSNSSPLTVAGSDGVAVVGPMDLFMAGLWELTVAADDGAGTADQAVFTFCLEG